MKIENPGVGWPLLGPTNIYSRYALPSIHYYLSIHHEGRLDSLARKLFKISQKIQKNCVTDVSLFHPYMLGLKAPSKLYKKAQVCVFNMIRMKGDKVVIQALDSRLERESKWKTKSSTFCDANKIFQDRITNQIVSNSVLESDKNRAMEKQRTK